MKTQEEIIDKLKEIFEIFLQENFATTNNVYFEKLITHLKAKENAFVLEAPFAIDWVDRCITLVTERFDKVHPKVISFMFTFCSFLLSNEWLIVQLRQRNIMARCYAFMERDDDKFNPSIKLGCIRFLTASARYSLGIGYLRDVKAWRLLIKYANNEHTVYVVREARCLLYDLIYKYSVKLKEDEVVLEILAEILKPIYDNMYNLNDEHITIQVDDSELLHKISSSLDLLSYILQQTLESAEKTNLTHLLKVHHDIDITIWKLIEMTHNRFFVAKILSTITSINFANLVYQKLCDREETQDPENYNDFGLTFFNTIKFCVQRTDGITFVQLAELNHVLWKKLGTRAPKEIMIEDQRISFENQLICVHMMPLFLAMSSCEITQSDWFESYLVKLLGVSCDQTLRMCYSLRDAFITNKGTLSENYTVELAHKCIHSILSLENILDRQQAVLVCQTLLYLLKEVVVVSAKANGLDDVNICTAANLANLCTRESETIIEDPNLLHSILVGLQALIKRFKITWKESVETIGLVNCVAFLLENRNLDARCTIQALKLIQLAIEHFLSPNMALLVDNLQGSGLLCLGPIITKRMHDAAWEVRDTALEISTSIANISRIKFPAFQRFLVDFKIPPIVYEMAKHDSETYVRASAFKCLSKMVSINLIWENDLSQLDLIDHLLYVLYNESEDMVRTEAILTLSMIYDQRKIPLKYKNILFSTLNYCIVGDHHWEVKINALCFWKMEFQRQFTNQGMIDGVFPSVTFSKEHKKIVTLTEKEIKLRIAKVFIEVQQYGYFGVLLKCLRDANRYEVVKFVTSGLARMKEKFQLYDLDTIIEVVDSLTMATGKIGCDAVLDTVLSPPMTPSIPSVTSESMDVEIEDSHAETVIEDILNAQDINLLQSVYESQMQINNEVKPAKHIDEFFYKKYAIPVRVYITEVKKLDLQKMLQEHEELCRFEEGFVSLLDDILQAIKREDELFVSDCY